MIGAMQATTSDVRAKFGDDKICPVFSDVRGVDALKRSSGGEWCGWAMFFGLDELEDKRGRADSMDPEPADAGARPPARPATGLAHALKEGTKEAHAEAESVVFVRRLLGRTAPLEAYICLLAALREIYCAMEFAAAALEPVSAAVRATCAGGRAKLLARTQRLDDDLDFFAEADAAAVSRARDFGKRTSAATRSYVSSLGALAAAAGSEAADAEAAGELLVAHLYTRYLGDLSGGQILRRAVVRAYSLDGGDDEAVRGASFYDFSAIGSQTRVRKFKNDYREVLDSLDVETRLGNVVEEAVDAFRRNTALLRELDELLPPEAEDHDRPARAAPAPKPGEAKRAVCPFLVANPDRAPATLPKTCPAAAKAAPAGKGAALQTAAACPFAAFKVRDYVIVVLVAVVLSWLAKSMVPPDSK
ncbi:hypothetical protein M885DRAFT_521528 [Pelagophyceae sp. CCMP2097]|nr:hypothetical protein M885DRAFT_521528 [Pelagophyceae sp. CCMP2097]|mmetsp:Transcript_3306/g.10008  ORF Transcript_3306/g.10008 Transcript_3306/m.10008 type:complete len:418 (+) Transcript_3306:368-1621(+)